MEDSLKIAFLWHMHQPVYKDPLTEEYILPWTLLHATKDYYDMIAILDDYPLIHQTFNLVPSLIEQINDYSSGNFKDRYRELSLKDPEVMTKDEKLFLLTYFFQANIDNMIKPLPRYWELLKKRGLSNNPLDLKETVRFFLDDDYQDLQLLFNLAWIDPSIRDKDKELLFLLKKERGFTKEEKILVLKKQLEITKKILPKYRELSERGTVELTTSPYFHPIMPLLCDSYSAKEGDASVTLPKNRLEFSDDALTQLQMGLKLHEETFGLRPKGLWPSEGSVSPNSLSLIAGEGIQWVATDEEILSKSIGRSFKRDSDGNCIDTCLYEPYEIVFGEKKINIIFRDHLLSDLIGFEYASWDAQKAVDDFLSRLSKIRDKLKKPSEHLVSIILDGENVWETFKDDGHEFLNTLYSRLSEDTRFDCVTVSEFLKDAPPLKKIDKIFSGSWINHNFGIWIGGKEENNAWDLIAEARKSILEYEATTKKNIKKIQEAWRRLYTAEGSDWFWWYGDDHITATSLEFDLLLRGHLKKIYELIGKEKPIALNSPILRIKETHIDKKIPFAFINPVFDGEVTSYFEWLYALPVTTHAQGGAMHKVSTLETDEVLPLIERIIYGFNLSSLFFRLDFSKNFLPFIDELDLTINIIKPIPSKAKVTIKDKNIKGDFVILNKKDKTPQKKEKINNLALGSVIEIGLDFFRLGLLEGDEVRFFVEVNSSNDKKSTSTRWPETGEILVEVPGKDFELHNWMV
ncbi:MAG: hypothetical protein KAT46_00875 [Deltaproteobacteria bacterium]|nr:hypothetical protein [Deltaproteobacteria bacterium]